MTIRVLQLSPFPTDDPLHGGQLRAHHTGRILEAAGVGVRRLRIFRRSHFPKHVPDIDLDMAKGNGRYDSIWQVSDFAAGATLAADAACYAAFTRALEAEACDAVVLDEPWLWPALRRFIDETGARRPVIYSAYNVEHVAKGNILADAKLDREGEIAAAVAALEIDLSRRAAACVATTAHDAAVLGRWATRTAVAPNGTVLRKLRHLGGILPAALEPINRYVLFVGSGHPPNATGFWTLVMSSLDRLRPDQRVAVAGSVCQLIEQKLQGSEYYHRAQDRLCLLGVVSDFALSCLIANASALLLPLTYGGGSNLKTAEALVSGKRIVATTTAFRGYEAFLDAPGVAIAGTPPEFANAIASALASDNGYTPRPNVANLLWERTLQPLVDVVKDVARRS